MTMYRVFTTIYNYMTKIAKRRNNRCIVLSLSACVIECNPVSGM